MLDFLFLHAMMMCQGFRLWQGCKYISRIFHQECFIASWTSIIDSSELLAWLYGSCGYLQTC